MKNVSIVLCKKICPPNFIDLCKTSYIKYLCLNTGYNISAEVNKFKILLIIATE